MSIKKSNEITLKVISTKEMLIQDLIKKGFKQGSEFSLDDYYFVPATLDLKNMSIRDILSKTVMIRDIFTNNEHQKQFTYKIKNFDSNGQILDQQAINCAIYSIGDGKNLLSAIGFIEIMNIKENDVLYYKDNLKLAIKDIEGGDILIEIETNSQYNTIDKLKDAISKLELPVQANQYFIKKAEIELSKILNRL